MYKRKTFPLKEFFPHLPIVLALGVISFYQIILSPLLKTLLGTPRICRYSPTCSEYTKQALRNHGIIKGSLLGLRRILACRPGGAV